MFSEEYLNWVKKENIKDLTRNQSKMAEFLLSEEGVKHLKMIGSFDNVFSSVRKYVRENQKEEKIPE